MANDLFEKFIAETIEGFNSSDCEQSFVLSDIVLSALKRRSLKEAQAIFLELFRNI